MYTSLVRLVSMLGGLVVAGAVLAVSTCVVGIPDLETRPVPDAGAGAGGQDAGDGGGGAGGSAGGGVAGSGGTLPSYREVVLDAGPLLYWRLGESAGEVAHNDLSTTSLLGRYQSVSLGAEGAIVGDSDTAASFDDGSTLAVLPRDAGSPGTYDDALDFAGHDSFSLEGWFRPEPPGPQPQHLLGKELPLGQDPMRGYGLTSNEDRLRFSREFEGTVDEVEADPLAPYEFTHVVATYDGDGMRMCLYQNGELAGCNEDASTSIAGHWGQFGVGYPGTAGYEYVRFNGVADEIAVYGKALTQAEVEEHYQAGIR